jgi:hypothetical protein
MYNENIEYVSQHKILGVTFQCDLRWNQHITELMKKADKRFNLLRMLSNRKFGANTRHILTLHQSLILSVLEYGDIIYDETPKQTLKKLDTNHNKGLRLATGALGCSRTSSLLIGSGMLPLELRREIHLLKHATKCLSHENNSMGARIKRRLDENDMNQTRYLSNTLF